MSGFVATRRAGSSNVPATDGSRTIVLHDSQPREEGEGGQDHTSAPDDESDRERMGGNVVGVLHLRGARRSGPRVAWTEDVVDNEGMGKKKSKICCIYHKPKRFDESSSESSSSDSDSDAGSSGGDDGRARAGGKLAGRKGRRKPHRHSHDDHSSHDYANGTDHSSSGGLRQRDGANGTVVVQDLSDEDMNAYEQQPGKKGKGKANGNGKGERKDPSADT